MHAGQKLHVAGIWIICQGADGLSRGDMLSGAMGGKLTLCFVPLHLLALGHLPQPKPWVESWWPDDLLEWLSHNDWFGTPQIAGNFA
jgi:hypothetical protein